MYQTFDDIWEADLVDLRAIKSYNNNYTFILVVIDVLNKYVWVELLRDKSCTNIVSAFQRIFSRSNNRIPVILQTDKGKEFVVSKFQNFKKYRYHFWNCKKSRRKSRGCRKIQSYS